MSLKLKFKIDPTTEALLKIRPRVRLKIIRIKEQHLKRLQELSKNSSKQESQLEEPNEEQLQWVNRKMRGSARTWKTWNEGIYFREEHKRIK